MLVVSDMLGCLIPSQQLRKLEGFFVFATLDNFDTVSQTCSDTKRIEDTALRENSQNLGREVFDVNCKTGFHYKFRCCQLPYS